MQGCIYDILRGQHKYNLYVKYLGEEKRGKLSLNGLYWNCLREDFLFINWRNFFSKLIIGFKVVLFVSLGWKIVAFAVFQFNCTYTDSIHV